MNSMDSCASKKNHVKKPEINSIEEGIKPEINSIEEGIKLEIDSTDEGINPEIDSIEEGIKPETISLAPWGKDIVDNYITPINEIFEYMSEVSDDSVGSLSPILSDLPRCKYCTCGEINSMCDCMNCRKKQRIITPEIEYTQVDSDTSTCIDSKLQNFDTDVIQDVSNHSIYRAFQEEVTRGTEFIFDVDKLFNTPQKNE